MDRRLLLTTTAENDLLNITEYLVSKFGFDISEAFIDRFNEVCDNILVNPTIYPVVDGKRDTRKRVISRQSIIYYRVHQDQIEVLSIFDTRQNPRRLKYILE